MVLNHGFEFLTKELQEKISRYTVKTNDLIISIVGTIGIVRIIHDSLNMANLTENCAKVTKLKGISSDYLYYFLNSPIGKNEIEMRTVGGVQGKLPLYNISSLIIMVPNRCVMNDFRKPIELINDNQKFRLRENVILEELRKTLLSKMTKAEAIS
jgi:type I restriction enzyme S subunit